MMRPVCHSLYGKHRDMFPSYASEMGDECEEGTCRSQNVCVCMRQGLCGQI